MSKLQDAYNSLIAHFPQIVSLAPLINSKNKFSDEEKHKMLQIISEHVDIATDIEEDIERRMNLSVGESGRTDAAVIPMYGFDAVEDVPAEATNPEDEIPFPTPASEDTSTNYTGSVVVPPHLTVTEYGKAFRGTEIAAVPVVMEPILYQSRGLRWSWQTKVSVDPDFRYINVSNFYAKAKDLHGNWYALVDKAWKTTQPLFKDFCNK